jgi:histidinol-phosphate aminotransferase
MRQKVQTIVDSRALLIASLANLASLGVGNVIGRNDANFVLLPIFDRGNGGVPDNDRAQKIYKRMAEQCGVVVRYRGGELGCAGCLRITVGTAEENRLMLQKLEESLRLTLLD